MQQYKSLLITLPNNQTISYLEYGSPHGNPVFYFHGITSSRLSGESANEIAKKMNIRLIAIDRPGIGFSTPIALKSIQEWTENVKNLADLLRIGTFSILGHSAGGAYALASAYQMPERLENIGVVGSAIPFTSEDTKKFLPAHMRFFQGVSEYIPWCISGIVALLRILLLNKTDKVLEANRKILSLPDQKIFDNYKLKKILLASAFEACRQGSRGISQDAFLLSSEWGFDIKKVFKKITIWHGTEDLTIPFSAGRYLHAMLPNSEFIPQSNRGHLFLFSEWEQILERFI